MNKSDNACKVLIEAHYSAEWTLENENPLSQQLEQFEKVTKNSGRNLCPVFGISVSCVFTFDEIIENILLLNEVGRNPLKTWSP